MLHLTPPGNKVSSLANWYDYLSLTCMRMLSDHFTEMMLCMQVWNFADFATDQQVNRVGSKNHKGLFTRQRQPKAAARMVKARYAALSQSSEQQHDVVISESPPSYTSLFL
jgi:hypothetical protein